MNSPESESDRGTWIVPLAGAVAAALVLGAMLRLPPIQNANDESRWCTVWSLVERGTYAIDDAPWTAHTVDKIRRDGHYYSSKPPLFPTLLAGFYWLQRHVLGWSLDTHRALVVRSTLFLVNIVPLMIFVALYARFVAREYAQRQPFVLAYCTLAAALGTYLAPYCVTLTSHTVAGFCCMATIYVVWRISRARPTPSAAPTDGAWFALAGLLAGLLPALDLLAAPFCVCVFLGLLWIDPARTMRAFVPAALVPIAAFLLTNWLVMETVVPAYAFKSTELYHYPGSFWENPRGIAANTDSRAVYLLHMLVGHHGWFTHTPIFLLAILAALRRPLGGPAALPSFNLLVLANFVFLVVFYLIISDDYGGTCQGLRWLFWQIPLLLMLLPPAVQSLAPSRAGRGILWAALALSVFSAAYALPGPWGSSWLHELIRSAGWITY
ncbi:MAG: hypothetical protein CHACPFDD_02758 [Phycisphaerae bacterium]|nr:hypothetical protein [Phycisphaerae bacterium]